MSKRFLDFSTANRHLSKARVVKNDEFYTKLNYIERELKHYEDQFKNKIVYCNCDNYLKSNFFKYFLHNFKRLGLKKLIATCFNKEGGIHAEYTEDGFYKKYLNGPGDFRSKECIDLLKKSDIVVTNPPFSFFREFISQLIEYDKKFLVIGNLNANSYKEIFTLIKNNKLWAGVPLYGSVMEFLVPKNSEAKNVRLDEEGSYVVKQNNIQWFTNLEHNELCDSLMLHKKYIGNEKDYPKYFNCDAINVDKLKDIPVDYDGVMGVPLTFLERYNKEQFEIIGLGKGNLGKSIGVKPCKKEHKMQNPSVREGTLYMVENGIAKVPYCRVLIKRK